MLFSQGQEYPKSRAFYITPCAKNLLEWVWWWKRVSPSWSDQKEKKVTGTQLPHGSLWASQFSASTVLATEVHIKGVSMEVEFRICSHHSHRRSYELDRSKGIFPVPARTSHGEGFCRRTSRLCDFWGITSYSITVWLTAPIVLIKLMYIQAFASLDYHHGAEALISA